MPLDANTLPPNWWNVISETIQQDNFRACEMATPAYLYRPKLFIDGDKWCALYGENIQDGVVGFGDSPESAYEDFNRAWREPLKK